MNSSKQSMPSPLCKLSPPMLKPLLLAIVRARRDPAAFISFCGRNTDGTPLKLGQVHCELQQFLCQHSKALVQLPRDHGKSTQICGRILWELGRNPSLRVKIVCASEALSRERADYIRTAIRNNPLLKWVFPGLQPAQPWTTQRFSVQRPAAGIGPSVAALGIDNASTGSRADLMVCDDIVDVKSLTSKASREHVKQVFQNNLVNMLEPAGNLWCLSTPWHRDDLNAQLIANPGFALFRRAVGPHLEPVWPERWSIAALEERRQAIGNAAFERGYRLNFVSEEELLIPTHWVKYYQHAPSFDQLILAIDPALSTSAQADRSAIVVLGKAEQTIYCPHAAAFRLNTPDLLDTIVGYHDRYQPDLIVMEANGAFRGFTELLGLNKQFGSKIRPVVHHVSKTSRIAMLSAAIQRGEVLLHGTVAGFATPDVQELLGEMTEYPLGNHDDLVDALAMGTDFLQKQRQPNIR
ncbi:MAG: hypothetical protein R3B84_22220 [Zavarzinella sp.]